MQHTEKGVIFYISFFLDVVYNFCSFYTVKL